MNKKRKPKKGYIYLLRCNNDSTRYKYGCTSLTPEERCKKINSENKDKGFDFSVIAKLKSFDIYKDENNLKWNLLPMNAGAFGEVFYSWGDLTFTKKDIIKKFLEINGVLGE